MKEGQQGYYFEGEEKGCHYNGEEGGCCYTEVEEVETEQHYYYDWAEVEPYDLYEAMVEPYCFCCDDKGR